MKARHSILHPHVFVRRLMINGLIGFVLISLALFMGMLGYHHFESMTWDDAFVNAAMILSGMGPMGQISTHDGKLFAGFYALFSGLIFILIVGIVFAPVVHRFIKTIDLEDDAK